MPLSYSIILLIILIFIILLILYPNYIMLDLFVWMGFQIKAASMVYTRFNKSASAEEISVRGEYFRNLDTSGASALLIKCRPVTIAAIFYRWHSGDSDAKGEPPKIMNKWLTDPQLGALQMKKVIDLAKVILDSEEDVFCHILENMDATVSVLLLREVIHGGIPRAMEKLPPASTIHLLHLLKLQDSERVDEMIEKMTADYAAKIFGKVG